jgi:hypothetical protein
MIRKTINHFFPDLFDRIREIEDFRKKSEYKLTELITACIACFFLRKALVMLSIMTVMKKISR